ncbi:MAG: hypothetical protein RJQ09_10475 [Cyclobacteriaceae bacterium]
MNREIVVEALVNHIEGLGMKEIRAGIKGYPDPKKIKIRESQTSYSPDILAKTDKKVYLFDFADDPDALQKFAQKWKLFSTYTRNNHGDFYVVSMANREYTVKNFLDEQNIKAKVFPISTTE